MKINILPKKKSAIRKLLDMIETKNKLDYIDCDYDNDIYHEKIAESLSVELGL